MQVPPLVVLQFAPLEAFVSVKTGGIGGDGGGDGGGGGAGDAQITKPPLPVESYGKLDHVIVSPAAITTSIGPLLPAKSVPPMATLSQHASV